MKDRNILLDDDKPEQTESRSAERHGEAEAESDTTAQAAVPDDAVEFPPIAPDGDVEDVPWVM